MTAPPDHAVLEAVITARRSPCSKSRRGAAVFAQNVGTAVTGSFHVVYGTGTNGPPPGFACDGTPACRLACRFTCEHAEARAVRHAADFAGGAGIGPMELVHVKIGERGELVSGGGPSCVPCSRMLLDSRIIVAVWLYEQMPEEWCPHRDALRTACTFCQGVDCIADRGKCDTPGPCAHDVLERHGNLPIVGARWRRYEVDRFHELSLIASNLPVIRVGR